jgi:DNA-binding beta-propeller fold protein YncE
VRPGFTLFISLVLVFASAQTLSAQATKIRWVASIYADGSGRGLKHPEGVACSRDQFVVADTGNNRLVRYRYQDEMVIAEALFDLGKLSPAVVQVDSKGDLYFLDNREGRISVVSASGGPPVVLKPKNLPSSARIVPRSFEIDGNDSIYIVDIFSEQVLVLNADGEYLKHISFPEEYGFFSDVAVDRSGNVFLVDSVEAAVYLAAKDAERFSRLTESMREYMNFPTSLAVDEEGTIYLVDQYGSGLALVSRDGAFLGRKLGMGWNESLLFYPAQICIGAGGKMLIADRNNSRVQVFSLGKE